MTRKRPLREVKHPLDSHPFEAILSGSWQSVEFLTIKRGTVALHFKDNNYVVMEKGPVTDIRLRSRKATITDCSCFLRPGIDICVLSNSQNSSDENSLKPVWADAKISSIQRKPHETECSCQYFVNFYVNQGCLNSEVRTLSKEIKVFGRNEISIIQKLVNSPREDQHYRWDFSEDCHTVPHAKLLSGKFLSDISWLVVASAIKQVSFCVRSVDNKIVYQILGNSNNSSQLNSDSQINAVNFRVDNGMVVPIVSQVVSPDANKADQAPDSLEDEASPSYNPEGLRRSKRRNVQPERYLGCDATPQLDVGFIRTRPIKFETRKEDDNDDDDDDLSMPLSCLFGLQGNTPVKDGGSGQKFNKTKSCQELIVYARRPNSNEVESGSTDKNEHQSQLAIVPVANDVDPIAVEHPSPIAKVPKYHAHKKVEIPTKYHHLMGSPEPKRNNIDLLTLVPHNHPSKIPDLENYKEKIDELSSGRHYSYGNPKLPRKISFGLYDMDVPSKWEGINSKGTQGRKHHSTCSRSSIPGEERTYKDRSLSAGAYKELIDSYLKRIDTKPSEEEPPITDQWAQFKETTNYGQIKKSEISQKKDEEEIDELDILWREMDVSLASTYLDDDAQDSNAAPFTEAWENSNKRCQHDFRLNEEIGIYCLKCGFISTEIKDVSAPFLERPVWHQEEKQCSEVLEPEPKADEDDDLNLVLPHASSDEPISEEKDVWALIPELRHQLHDHQKKAFEFLWRNIAGSMDPALMEAAAKKRGGCVISHAPGAGKTFLIIAFLVSYLKLFPGKRPLVLAPKTTLYTWYKEFIKWKIPIPVHLIHGRRTYRVFKQNTEVFHGGPKPTDDVKHILDCLEKIQKWHSHPSVLVMGYTSFLTLMREDAKFDHRKYMAKVLRESPGILILDEGHNPRSTKSRLRKCLMKVQTELRILLSGTLFQNNFCEYFNTLCLARPNFAHEVLKKLDSKYRRNKKGTEKAPHLIEARARKYFLDNIARKIDSSEGEERMEGLNMLRNITSGFIDVYEGGSSDNLPGLQIYTLLMNCTDVQHEILQKLQKKMAVCNGYPLELELMITLGSIHPWLVKTAVCADKFFTVDQLNALDKFKFDLKKGSKVKFVLSLVYRVVRNEKILIFCHNIAPVKLFVELFELFFGWQKGREVLVLTGELELFERGRVMDQFEDSAGASKILLASISSCAEGISLTAASRVILLDSEWNPSKTKQAVARAYRPGQQKIVYVYQLLATGTLEEDKHRRTTWKEWVSSMIFSEDFVQDPSKWQAEKIEDDILREMIGEDRSNSFHMIMKNEKASISASHMPSKG